ncbi:leucine rich repeat domain-containing protein [Coprinopsis sp. MPI-PUGE-AT-0042]|nr:leucine rich repeat domain-containing protein [Coprinopsis sp. MPI-PUGE-AT-0042]
MEPEKGDDYLRRLATYIRENERGLAEAGPSKRRRQQPQSTTDFTTYLNPLSWIGIDTSAPAAAKPVVFTTDTHHLFYVLMRLEALGYDVGTLDVHIDNPSRPMSYVNIFTGKDKSDTLSMASIRSSFSAVSKLSLGGSWWSSPQPLSIDQDLKYIYSSFTKLPALTIHAPTRLAVAELLADPPGQNALPLDSFKNVQALQCIDVDPRTLLGWDRLSASLRSLTIKKSGLEDISDIFIGAVLDDEARRKGSLSRSRRRRIPRGYGQGDVQSTPLPNAVMEDTAGESAEETPSQESQADSPSPTPTLGSMNWAFLKHLSLADNALTFIPSEPLAYLTSVTHLDLSSNLLVSVPPALGALFNLISLNLTDNMIDSVLGIYLNLGSILSLNLSHNRLESLCGLERLRGLERVDLRGNLIDESQEVGRLATLPNISAVWIESNPFCEYEENYRTTCFGLFAKEGKTVSLDGSLPGFYEKRNISTPPGRLPASATVMAYSPPVVAIGHSAPTSPPEEVIPQAVIEGLPSQPSPKPSPNLQPTVPQKPKRRHQKRIVELGEAPAGSEHSKGPSEATILPDRSVKGKKVKKPVFQEPESIVPSEAPEPKRRSRHSRYQTEYHPSSPPPGDQRFDAPPASATMSRSAMRRARQSMSMYEGPGEERDETKDNAEEYRRRIEALRKDMGDGWLKVFSQQSEIKS